MAINITNADKALKTYYLDVVAEQLNSGVNPLLAAFSKSASDVWGKEIRKATSYGFNGGIGSGTEDGNLPGAGGNNYEEFVLSLKNLYGAIEISDKAIRASENSAGAFVNLLNAEMDSLLKSSTFNFGRMLFGDGSGVLAKVTAVAENVITLSSVKNLFEGMIIDFKNPFGGDIAVACGRKILQINRASKSVTISGSAVTTVEVPLNSLICMQGSYNNEITGINALFRTNNLLYGLDRTTHDWLKPYVKSSAGDITELMIQTAIDSIEEVSGGKINFIVCSWGVRRSLQKLFAASNRNIETMELAGGYKAMSYNGIPIVADRFCDDGMMYLLNTEDFTLHQLCDWQWLEGEDGTILRQVAGKPVYTATLVKYADLLCSRPCGQGRITGITEI